MREHLHAQVVHDACGVIRYTQSPWPVATGTARRPTTTSKWRPLALHIRTSPGPSWLVMLAHKPAAPRTRRNTSARMLGAFVRYMAAEFRTRRRVRPLPGVQGIPANGSPPPQPKREPPPPPNIGAPPPPNPPKLTAVASTAARAARVRAPSRFCSRSSASTCASTSATAPGPSSRAARCGSESATMRPPSRAARHRRRARSWRGGVGHDQRRAPLHQGLQALVNLLLDLHVDRAGGVVEHEDRGVHQ